MDANRPFGDFLRSRRARLAPDTGHEPGARRRRTPGLKREEVAQRAGISAEWCVKLEQGRAVSPSAETVEALGRALRFDAVELAHLRALAAAGGRQPFQRETVPDALRRLVASLREPAYLTGQRWDILAWNEAATALFGDFGRLAPEDRNILHWMFTDPAAQALFGATWTGEARRMVSLFRAAHDLWPGDAGLRANMQRGTERRGTRHEADRAGRLAPCFSTIKAVLLGRRRLTSQAETGSLASTTVKADELVRLHSDLGCQSRVWVSPACLLGWCSGPTARTLAKTRRRKAAHGRHFGGPTDGAGV